MSETKYLTSVNVTGVASASYDTAIFSCSTEGKGKTGPLAKEDARPAIDALLAVLDKLESDSVKIDRKKLRTEFSVAPAYEYDQTSRQNRPCGYTASYSISFQSSSVKDASRIHDALTSVEDVTAQSPDFKIKSLDALHKKALRDAKKKCDDRFADECDALGLKVDDYILDTYITRYDESESAGARAHRGSPPGVMMAMSAGADMGGGGPAPVEVQAGKATVTVNLTASYRPRTALDGAGKASSKPAAAPTGGVKTASRSASAGNGG